MCEEKQHIFVQASLPLLATQQTTNTLSGLINSVVLSFLLAGNPSHTPEAYLSHRRCTVLSRHKNQFYLYLYTSQMLLSYVTSKASLVYRHKCELLVQLGSIKSASSIHSINGVISFKLIQLLEIHSIIYTLHPPVFTAPHIEDVRQTIFEKFMRVLQKFLHKVLHECFLLLYETV